MLGITLPKENPTTVLERLDVSAMTERAENSHIPVMLTEVMEQLSPPEGGVVVDCTVGLGGHAAEIIKTLGPEGHYIGLDRDGGALEVARQRLKDLPARRDLIQEDYRNLDDVLGGLGVSRVDGILLDLGISSYQLNDPQRGFSLRQEGPLDMRMDQRSYISAYDLVNSLSEKELSSILKNFGEERWHYRIARFLVEGRAKKPIRSTKELSDLVREAIPRRYQNQKIHPATRTFQAIRIAVNRELESLGLAMDKCVDLLNVGGRVCVISFHSLEDRTVKERFRDLKKEGVLEVLTKKPLRPTEDEVQSNPRARSARLRAAERIQ